MQKLLPLIACGALVFVTAPLIADDDIATAIAQAFEPVPSDEELQVVISRRIRDASTKVRLAEADHSKEAFHGPQSFGVWTDSTGKYRIEAMVVNLNETHVRFKKRDNSLSTVERARLSASDIARLKKYEADHRRVADKLQAKLEAAKAELSAAELELAKVNAQLAANEALKIDREAEIARRNKAWEDGREERERQRIAQEQREEKERQRMKQQLLDLLELHDQDELNDTVAAGGLTYTVEGFASPDLKDTFGNRIKADSRWLAVQLTIKNSNREQWRVPRITLLDLDGNEFSASTKSHYLDEEILDGFYELNPGVSTTRWILFDVPAGIYVVRVSDDRDATGKSRVLAMIDL